MNPYHTSRRGPATASKLEQLGVSDVKPPTRAEKAAMRKAYREHAERHGQVLESLSKREYKKAVIRQHWAGQKAKDEASRRQYQDSKLNSLNKEKAARVQAIREAWARVKEKESKNS